MFHWRNASRIKKLRKEHLKHKEKNTVGRNDEFQEKEKGLEMLCDNPENVHM